MQKTIDESEEMFSWMKASNIIAGVSFIVISTIVLIDFNLATNIILVLFGITLLILGIIRIFVGYYYHEKAIAIKRLKIFAGIIMIIISLIVLSTITVLGSYILVILLASALILNGALRATVGFLDKEIKLWLKVTLISVGLISILFGILAIVFYKFGFFTIVILLALIFIFNGFTRIMYTMQVS
jgi:uncharacterized membrane protein HdeD (DUF308 family)